MKKRLLNLLIFSTLAVALLDLCIAHRLHYIRASFGESCNRTVPCDARKSLVCTEGTCHCAKETETMFDSAREKCVVLPGKRCLSIDPTDMEIGMAHHNLECVKYAGCNATGYCACLKGFYENSEGQCLLQKGNKEDCEKDQECRRHLGLICVDGKCSCNSTEAVYSGQHESCLAKVGASCNKYPRCVQNAYASSCGSGYSRGGNDLCECRNLNKNATDGLCLGRYHEECDPISSPCTDDFICIEGTCTCPFPKYQKFDFKSGKCISFHNGPCLETVKGKPIEFQCVPDAECRSDNGLSECLCKKGYIRSANGQCKKAFGAECRYSYECDQVPGSYLICKEGRCSCDELQIYDEDLKQCLSLWGAKCDEYQDCVQDAFCQRERHTPESRSGICRCKSGFKVDADRKCV